jgi:flagellar hook-length control protein FliK
VLGIGERSLGWKIFMQMHLALFSGTADPQSASQNVEGGKTTVGGEAFAIMVEARDTIALAPQSLVVDQADVQIPATLPIQALPEEPQNLPEIFSLLPEAPLINGSAAFAPVKLPIAAMPDVTISPANTAVEKDEVALEPTTAGATTDVTAAIPIEVAADVSEKPPVKTADLNLLTSQGIAPNAPAQPPFEGDISDEIPLAPSINRDESDARLNAAQMLSVAPLLKPDARPEGAQPALNKAHVDIENIKAVSPLPVGGEPVPPVTDQKLTAHIGQTEQPVATPDQKSSQISEPPNKVAAKLSPEASASLENPETPAALVKASASQPSPEQANAARAAVLYQSGAKFVPQERSTPTPSNQSTTEQIVQTSAEPEGIAPNQPKDFAQLPKPAQPPIIENSSKPRPTGEAIEIAAPQEREPSSSKNGEQAPSNLAIEAQKTARPSDPAALAMLSERRNNQQGPKREAEGSPRAERLEKTAENAPSNRTNPYTVLHPSAAPPAQSTTAFNEATTTDTAAFSMLSNDVQGSEPLAFGLGAAPSEGRLGPHAALPQALLNNPELPQRVAQQLVEAARALPDRPVELSLNPEELGRVRMTMNASDGGMAVVVAVERSDTLDLMRRHIDTLAAEFRALGYRDVSFSFSQQGQGDTQGDGQDAGPIKALARAEDETTTLQNTPHKLALDGAGGMDIRL